MSLAVLFLCVVAIIIVLIGFAVDDASPYALVAPVLVGFWAILDLRRR